MKSAQKIRHESLITLIIIHVEIGRPLGMEQQCQELLVS